MSFVFVVDQQRKPLDPVPPGRARYLLKAGHAVVLHRYPFTLIMREEKPNATPQPLRLKIDPGSKTTGVALLNDATGQVVWAAELPHRGHQVKEHLDQRRSCRRNRRSRHTRYRAPRFTNRVRPKAWLPPSLMSRLDNILTWVARLHRYAPVTAISQELVKFDLQVLEDPAITGIAYQQGTLAGYEVREYLLEKWHRHCAYCGATDQPFEVDHIIPRSRPGTSNRIGNLALACHACNQAKGKRTGRYQGKVAVKASGYFAIATATGTVTDIAAQYCRKLHRSDGYSYQKGDRACLPLS